MVEVLDPVVEPRRSRSGIGWAVLATVVAVLLLWIASSVTVRIFEISGSTFTIPKWHLAARQLLQVGAGAACGFVALQGRRRSKYGIMGRVFAAVIALALLGFGWQFYFGAAILKISTAT
ncbi:MAG: hypothetical protein WBM90_02455, partial [Acidimicrobiia bacterium]